MTVLVAGSSGLIGTALVERLVTRGPVVRLVRTGTAGARQIRWDPAVGTIDAEALEAVGPIDAVVNLAGAGIADRRWSPQRKRLIVESRTRATRLLAETIAGWPAAPPVLINASAVGYYGLRGDEVLTEQSPSGSGFLADVCRQWEAATAPAADVGARTVLLRTGIVLSGSGGVLQRQLPLFRLGLGGRSGSGSQYRSWITLEDEVGAIVHCLDDGSVSGPVNATAPHPATDADLATAIGETLHRPTALRAPSGALRLILGSEMAHELVLGGQRVLPGVLEERGYRFRHPELAEAVDSVLIPPG
ncbi:MAG: TIGR01777 family oxidoreductase [Acidimicrobiales bacterium]